MPAFLTHFWILDQAVNRNGSVAAILSGIRPRYRPARQRHTIAQCAYLGAMGPDLAGYNQGDLHAGVAGTLFDVIHRKKSGVVVANLLDETRRMPRGSMAWNSCFAFAFGYMAHIAGDIIVHPYINAFAGVYENQPINRVYHSPIAGDVAMHMFAECHMDSFVAAAHYGSGDQMSNEPNDDAGRSWSDYLNDLVTGGFATIGHNPTAASAPLIAAYTRVIRRTYPGMNAQEIFFIRALGKMFDALDLGYDAASKPEDALLGIPVIGLPLRVFYMNPPLDWWNLDFVEHRFYRNTWRRFEDFCSVAASVAADHFWPAAMMYLDSPGQPEDRKQFLAATRDWNLDMGLATRVYRVGETIHIRYDHSWAVFFTEQQLQRSIRTMNDELMRVCRDIARISGDSATHHETRTLSAPRSSRRYQHDNMDYGIVRIRCTAGTVQVSTSAAVWSDFTPLSRVTVQQGGDEILEIKMMDSTCDQKNRVVVRAQSSSATYEIEFISWDR